MERLQGRAKALRQFLVRYNDYSDAWMVLVPSAMIDAPDSAATMLLILGAMKVGHMPSV